MSNNEGQSNDGAGIESSRRSALYDSAIERNDASFTQLATAIFYGQEQFESDESERGKFCYYYPKLLKSFQNAHGNITDSYFCKYIIAGVVLTDRDEIHLVNPVWNLNALEVDKLLFACARLHIEARQHLQGIDRRISAQRIYPIISSLLDLLEELARSTQKEPLSEADKGNLAKTVATLQDDYNDVERHFKRSAQRNAQIYYLKGMGWGLFYLIPIIICLAVLMSYSESAPDAREPLLASLIAGGFGALVSVLARMTSGSLILNYETGKNFVSILGSLRPIVGAIFGTVGFTLLSSGVLPIAVPEDPNNQLFFFSAIGWLAGFNERWAQDMLVATGRRMVTTLKETETEGMTSPGPITKS